MSKITLFDSVRKFTGDLVDHWESQGHSVVIDRYWDASKVANSDVAFFEFVDNSLMRASDPNDSMYKEMGLTRPTGKKIIARCHDIDAWCGNHMRIQWDFVTDLVFVAKHIQDKVLSEIKLPKNVNVHLIKHGINPDKFTFREKPVGKNIVWVGHCNEAKNLPLALQSLVANPDYSLHVVGDQLDKWKQAYVLDFVNRNKLNFYHYEHVDDMNQFLDEMDFLLLTSMKEAWSYIAFESCCKGIKPLIHHFYGAENIFDKKYLWNKISEVKLMLEGEYIHSEYRNYAEVNYNFKEYLVNYDKLL